MVRAGPGQGSDPSARVNRSTILYQPATRPWYGMLNSSRLYFRFVLVIFLLVVAGMRLLTGQAASADHAEKLYQSGLADLKRADLPGARKAFEEVLSLAPRSPDAHNSLGWVLSRQGEVDSAISHFRTPCIRSRICSCSCTF